MPPSQGPRNVKQKKVAKPSGVFGPLAANPLAKAQGQAHAKTQRAQRKAEAKVVVPYVPKLAHPTSGQRGAAVKIVARGLQKQGITHPSQVAALPKAQRQRVNRAKGYATTNAERVNAERGRQALPGPRAVTNSELAALGKALQARTGSQLLPNSHHDTKFGIGPAAINVTGVERKLAGNPAAAFVKGTQNILAVGAKQKGLLGVLPRFTQDAVDFPANSVSSTYFMLRHPTKAPGAILESTKQTLEHPLRHPLYTALTLSGIEGAAGGSAGALMRTGALGKTAAKLGERERIVHRTVQTNEGVAAPVNNVVDVTTHSGDVIRKAGRAGVRHINERHLERKAVKAAKNLPRHRELTPEEEKQIIREKGITAPELARSGARPSLSDLEESRIEARQLRTLAKRESDPATREELLRQSKNYEHHARTLSRSLTTHQMESRVNADVQAPKVTSAEREHMIGKAANEATGKKPSAAVTLAARGITASTSNTELEAYLAKIKDAYPKLQTKAERKLNLRNQRAIQAAIDKNEPLRALAQAHHFEDIVPGIKASGREFVTDSPFHKFVSSLPSRRPGTLTTDQGALFLDPHLDTRVERGLINLGPHALREEAQARSRLSDAISSRESWINNWGYQKAGSVWHGTQAGAIEQARLAEQRTNTRWEPIHRMSGDWAIVPHDAIEHIRAHEQSVQLHPVMKGISSRWRKVVLAFSPRWLTGNVVEAAVRSVIAGVGPRSIILGNRVMKELKLQDRRAFEEARARMTGGGNYSTAARLNEQAHAAEELSSFGRAVHKLAGKPVLRNFVGAYDSYTKFVFNVVNGKAESAFQRAMLGRELLRHPLMDGHLNKLSTKAVEEAAHGLRDTNTQYELGRAIDRMYGRYQKFGPTTRAAIAQYTPFIAWSLNAVNFLYHVLPADHPVITSLLAQASAATEPYRKQRGLYLDFYGKTQGQLPPWLQGSIPGANNSHLRVSRYTPFGLLDAEGAPVVGGLANLVMPQLGETLNNWGYGKDYLNRDLSANPSAARDLFAGVVSFLEGQVPLAAQAAAVSGVHLPNMADTKTPVPPLGTRARKEFDPTMFTQAAPQTQAQGPTGLAKKYMIKGGQSNLDELAKKYQQNNPASNLDNLAKKYQTTP